MKYVILILLLPSMAFSQTYPNLIQHNLESVPAYFIKVPTRKATSVYRPLPNCDFVHNGAPCKMRSYDFSKFSRNVMLTCIYFKSGDVWPCFGARFFSHMQNNDGNGTLGPITQNILYNFLNFSGDKPAIESEWQKINGIDISGDPKWASAFLTNREYYYFVGLPSQNYNNPQPAIDKIIEIFDKVVDHPDTNTVQPMASPQDNASNNKESIALPNVYLNTIYR